MSLNFMEKQSPDSEKSEMKLKRPILLDTTLRDGEQSPGLYFTHSEKILIAQELHRAGVDVIEAGIPSMGKEEKDVIRALMRFPWNHKILAWNRLTLEDVCASLETGVQNIHVSIPTSKPLLTWKLHQKPEWIFSQMEQVISFALRSGLQVSLGAEDASRTEVDFLIRVFKHAENLGVQRVRYADTLGILTPDRTAQYIRTITDSLGIPLDFHGHNDMGMATANALNAWKSGAQVVSCSLLGLGERAGNTALEEFVGALHFLENEFVDYDLNIFRQICQTVARLSERPISPHKPFFGSEVFSHESGIHVDGLLKAPETYEFFPPEKVGGKRHLVVGKHSGRSALKYLAAQNLRSITDQQAQQFMNDLRALLAMQKGIDSSQCFDHYLSTLNQHVFTEEVAQ